MRTRIKIAVLGAAAASLAVASAAVAETSASLPGDTPISIDNTSPTDGDEFLVPIGDTTIDVDDEGTATVGAAEVVKDTSLAFVIDASGSTGLTAGVDCDNSVGIDTRLVCEKVGALAANAAAADTLSSVKNAAVVRFESSASTEQGLTTDFAATAAAINSLSASGFTNYRAAVDQAQSALVSAETKRIVVFLSDGFANQGTLAGAPSFGPNTVVKAFAIGNPAQVTCGGNSSSGTLDAVAALGGAAGSECQQVSDPSTLADVITAAIGSSLDSVEIQVDGGGYVAIPAADLNDSLPLGPNFVSKTVNWTTLVSGLGIGSHEICVRANGTDAGGSGSVTECKTITVLQLQSGGTALYATNELGEDDSHTISVTVAGDTGGRDVTFEVSGVNPQTDTVQTDANGDASFTFSSPQDSSGLGLDTIEVSITVNGVTQTLVFEKEWVDTTPPSASCVESVNPNGKTPAAPGKGGQGQNQDGFYKLMASDDIWSDASLQVFVTDDGSGTVFGPYDVGDVIKWTEDDEAIPTAKPIGGPNSEVRIHIIGNGDALVTAVDGSGNVSDAVSCLVPPQPK